MGESISVVRETGANSTSSPLLRATGNAVPNFHPAGSVTDATKLTSSELAFLGYRTTAFQFKSRLLLEAAGPFAPALSRAVSAASVTLAGSTPAGTETWNSYISIASRCH